MIAPRWMIRARWQALKHTRFGFARKGCRIWRIYSYLGWRTHAVFCECGQEFGASEPMPSGVLYNLQALRVGIKRARGVQQQPPVPK